MAGIVSIASDHKLHLQLDYVLAGQLRGAQHKIPTA